MNDEELRANPALAVWWHLARSFSLVTRECDRLLTHWGLTGPQFGVLHVLLDAGGSLPLHEIGQRLLVTCGNITGVVDRLERGGYVTRERSPDDRRVTLARVTAKGRCACLAAREALVAHMTGLLAFMEPAEHRRLAAELERIHLHLRGENS